MVSELLQLVIGFTAGGIATLIAILISEKRTA